MVPENVVVVLIVRRGLRWVLCIPLEMSILVGGVWHFLVAGAGRGG